MEGVLKQVFAPIVATPGGSETTLGVFSKEEDAWDVLRAFLAKAGETDIVSGNITVWEIDYVGEDGQFILAEFDRNPCPVCEERSFWVEGDNERARCYNLRCGSWIEQNTFDSSRWDCGWPAANWEKRADDYKQAFRRLIEMRAQSTSAGTEHRMPSREAWLNEKDRERRTIQQNKFNSLNEDITE
ncbi:MAG: hypothetical protein QF440_02895 [Candidatus Thalassarchaeaceae archaeon]|jgi:hypothetical protein|nr:hypothetical protein [Candidatus Thalassarchaeaceae archaeon]